MADETRISHVRHGKSASRSVDNRVGDLAGRQHGVVARRQLLALGMGRGAIEDRIVRGQLRRVRRGVYALGYRPETRESRWMAAVLSAGGSAVLSHRSAGALWGIFPSMSIAPEVTRPTRCESRPGLRMHCGLLKSDETTRLGGIPVTSVPRTVLDIAALSNRRRLEKTLNEVEVRGLTDKLSIPDLLDRYPRKRGSANMKALLADQGAVRGVPRKELKERFRTLLDETDLPRPRLNADVAVRGRFFEADCLWGEQGVIVELDGRAVHGTPLAFEEDRERDRLLQAGGWRVIRITWRQLRDEPSAVVADLRRLLRRSARAPTL
jgi:predicted transcriptional regulator of viral defense system